MRLTSREKLLIIALVIIGMGAAFYNWIYVPYQARIDAGATALAKLEAEHDKLVRWQSEVAQTEVRLVEVQAQLNGWVAEARAVSDAPLAIVFLQNRSAEYGVRINAVRLTGSQVSLTFTAPNYLFVRNFLTSMEKMVAFEVLSARYAVPAGGTADGSFDIKMHIGPANDAGASEARTSQNPFVR